MKLLFRLLIFILTMNFTNSYSQFDKDIFNKVSQSMNFNKWLEINSLSIIYENRQKDAGDEKSFSEIKLVGNESVVVDKKKGFKSERKYGEISILLKENKKYSSFLSSVDNYKPDIQYHNQTDEIHRDDYNFILNNPDIQLIFLIKIFTGYKDSLIYIRNEDIYGDDCRMYFTPSIEKPIFKFFIDKNNKIKGVVYGEDFRTQTFYIDYKNIEGIIIPKTIVSFDNKYQNLYTLIDLKTDIYIPESIFY